MGIIPSSTGKRGISELFAHLIHGKVPTKELGSGTADSTTFLRGDQSWQTPPGGGGGDAITVNGAALVDADFDDATPAAPADSTNVKWQKDAGSPANVSAYVPSIDVARTWQTLQTFKDTTFLVSNNDVPTNTLLVSLGETASVSSTLIFQNSASRTYTFPDQSGDVALTSDIEVIDADRDWTTVQRFLDSGFAIIDATALRSIAFSCSSATSETILTLRWAGTISPTISFPSVTGTVAVVGDDPPAVAVGALGKVDLTGQTANIATTNLSNTALAGVYEVEVYLMTTTADAAAGTLTVTIGWTDNVGATTSTPITAFPLTATGRTTGRQIVRVASGEISYAVAVTGSYGTSQYAVYVRVVSLG